MGRVGPILVSGPMLGPLSKRWSYTLQSVDSIWTIDNPPSSSKNQGRTIMSCDKCHIPRENMFKGVFFKSESSAVTGFKQRQCRFMKHCISPPSDKS